MAGIKDLNDYEKRFYDVMKARSYTSKVMADSSGSCRGVVLTSSTGKYRFNVWDNSFLVETSKIESQGWGVRKRDVTTWDILKNLFTDEELKAFQVNLIVPDLDDGELVARIETTIKANEEEFAMRGIRQARRIALREAAPAMWRALSLITSDKIDRELLEDADPKAFKQCLEALEEAGEQDTQDLSVARGGLIGY